MKKYLLICLMALTTAGAGFLASCSEDGFDEPALSLSETEATASSGDEITVTISTTTDAGFKKLEVTKLWDGTPQGATETFDTPQTTYTYTVVDEDADHVVTINFKVTDKDNKTASRDLVISIELTPLQILLKYNWRLSEEIRKKTGEGDINDVYNDDVYRFNADGTYNKSIGAKADDYGDLVNSYCYYNLNSTTMRLLMSRRDQLFAADAVDTLDITLIDETKFYADITYYGLDVFNTGSEEVPYEEVEEYEKRFVAVTKSTNFDPYQPGNTDDAGPGACVPLTFENARKKK